MLKKICNLPANCHFKVRWGSKTFRPYSRAVKSRESLFGVANTVDNLLCHLRTTSPYNIMSVCRLLLFMLGPPVNYP